MYMCSTGERLAPEVAGDRDREPRFAWAAEHIQSVARRGALGSDSDCGRDVLVASNLPKSVMKAKALSRRGSVTEVEWSPRFRYAYKAGNRLSY